MRPALRSRWCPILALTLVGSALRADDPPNPTFANVTVHDPSIVRDGSTFWIFGSHMAAASTTDLIRWTQFSTSAAAPNNLARNGAPRVEFAEALTYAGNVDTFWAPDVIKLADGKYYNYYCACQGTMPLSALGLARADAVNGPYANVGLLLKSMGASPTVTPYNANIHPNVVDPAVFYDDTGRLWMVYGSYSGGIFILELDRAAGSPTIGQPLAGQGYGTKLLGGYHAQIEGGYVIYSPETQYYYLFTSFGGLAANGGYNIRVFRSANPNGPYFDAEGNNMSTASITNNNLATIAPYGVKLMGGYQFLHTAGEPGSASTGYLLPGHNSVHRDPATGKYFVVFHTRFVGRGEQHEVRVHQLFMNTDDWLVAAPHRYAGETIARTDAGRIVGNWKLVNHGKDITATVKTSANLALAADGTVSGAATGTWRLTGEYDLTLTLGGTTYNGVFVRQWDDDSQVWALAFSALAGNGVAVWGSKTAVDSTPAFLAQPDSQMVVAGTRVTLTAVASGDPVPTYQWKKDGVNVPGAIGSLLTIATVAAGDAGTYTLVATSRAGTATSTAATLTVIPQRTGDSRLINISTRALVGTGNEIMIAGFIIGGSGSKRVLIRAVGPGLAQYFAGTLTDPKLELTKLDGTLLATNDNWGDFADPAAIAAGPGAPLAAGSRDAAMIITLPAGQYTALVKGVNDGTGIALVELYDLETTSAARLINLSTRARVGTGASTMIAGFVVTGAGNRNVLIRALGPTLSEWLTGTLPDPQLVLTTLSGAVLANNDNWDATNGAAIVAVGGQTGAYPLAAGTRDSALFTSLPEGQYTPNITDRNGASGLALVEVYEAP